MQPPRPDEDMVIATPELVAFSYEIAGVGSRFVAALLDLFVVIGIGLLVVAVFAFLARLGGPFFVTVAIYLALFSGFGLTYGYFWFCEYVFNGQTLGKRAARLRVVGDNGEPISFSQAGIRNLIRFVDFLPGWYAIGLITLFVNGRGRRLGDLAAGTVVVRERKRVRLQDLPVPVAQPASAAGFAGAPAPPPPPSAVATSSWGPMVDDAAAKRFLALYMARRQVLDPVIRARLAAQVEPLLKRAVPEVLAVHGPSAALDALAFRSLPPTGPPTAPPGAPPAPPPPPGATSS
jgi:uncharacterized RDD family membrane protein YckC